MTTPDSIVDALTGDLPRELASDLVSEYLTIRNDASTKTLGRSSPGKFVEGYIQALQYIATGKFAEKPDVEKFLNQQVESLTNLDDGFRLCASRILRAMYTLRSKRNIIHKQTIDPNSYDLDFLHAGARWALAELFRNATSVTMSEAGRVIDLIHSPVGQLVEEVEGELLVHGKLSIRNKVLLTLQHRHPDPVMIADICSALSRNHEKSVKNAVAALWKDQLINGDVVKGYRLTAPGLRQAACVGRLND